MSRPKREFDHWKSFGYPSGYHKTNHQRLVVVSEKMIIKNKTFHEERVVLTVEEIEHLYGEYCQ